MRIVSVKVIPIKINGETSQWGNAVCDKNLWLGRGVGNVRPSRSTSHCVANVVWRRLLIESVMQILYARQFWLKTVFDSGLSFFLLFPPAAILFITPPSPRVCQPVHIWEHRQQGLRTGDHCDIRWVRWKFFWGTCLREAAVLVLRAHSAADFLSY